MEEADKMIEYRGEMRANHGSSDSEQPALPYLLGGSGRSSNPQMPRSLETILEQIKQTFQSLPPPNHSPPSILTTWEFLKSIHSTDIHKIASMIDKLSPQALLCKASEIEQLAHRLDGDQTHQFLVAEEMHLLRK